MTSPSEPERRADHLGLADYHDFLPGTRDIEIYWRWVNSINLPAIQAHARYWRHVSMLLDSTARMLRRRRDRLAEVWRGDAAMAFLRRFTDAEESFEEWIRGSSNNAVMLESVVEGVRFAREHLDTYHAHYQQMLGEWRSRGSADMVVYRPDSPHWTPDTPVLGPADQLVRTPLFPTFGLEQLLAGEDTYVISGDSLSGELQIRALYHHRAAHIVTQLADQYVDLHYYIDQPSSYRGPRPSSALSLRPAQEWTGPTYLPPPLWPPPVASPPVVPPLVGALPPVAPIDGEYPPALPPPGFAGFSPDQLIGDPSAGPGAGPIGPGDGGYLSGLPPVAPPAPGLGGVPPAGSIPGGPVPGGSIPTGPIPGGPIPGGPFPGAPAPPSGPPPAPPSARGLPPLRGVTPPGPRPPGPPGDPGPLRPGASPPAAIRPGTPRLSGGPSGGPGGSGGGPGGGPIRHPHGSPLPPGAAAGRQGTDRPGTDRAGGRSPAGGSPPAPRAGRVGPAGPLGPGGMTPAPGHGGGAARPAPGTPRLRGVSAGGASGTPGAPAAPRIPGAPGTPGAPGAPGAPGTPAGAPGGPARITRPSQPAAPQPIPPTLPGAAAGQRGSPDQRGAPDQRADPRGRAAQRPSRAAEPPQPDEPGRDLWTVERPTGRLESAEPPRPDPHQPPIEPAR